MNTKMNTEIKTQMNTRKTLSLLFKYAKKYWIIILFLPLLIGVDIGFEIGVAQVQGLFIDTANKGTTTDLMNVILFVVCLLLGAILLLALHKHLIVKLLGFVHRDLTLSLFDVINHMPFGKRQKYHSGELVTRLKDDAEHSSTIIEAFVEFITVFVLILFSFLYLIKIDVVLAVLGAVSSPILFFIGRFFDNRIALRSDDVQQKEQALRETSQEFVQGLPVIKTFQAKSLYRNQFMNQRKELNQSQTRLAMTNAMSRSVTEGSFQLIYIVALVFIAIAATRNTLTPGAIVTFSVLFELVVWPVIGLSDQYSRVQEGVGAFNRIFRLLKPGAEGGTMPKEAILPDADTAISLKNVYFQPEEAHKPLVKKVDFQLRKGETVLVIGPSGAGKSTFARLCSGLYEPTDGEVHHMGLPQKSNDGDSPRLVYVSQAPYLFTGTVRENIALAQRQATDRDIASAAGMAGLDTFIDGLPEGYDTVITEQGDNFSGGQKQRLSLSRAFLHRDCDIVIMDEPTSALDPAKEQQVVKSLELYLKNKSAILITHRPALLPLADRIIVMNEGSIAEEGTHEELAGREGFYSRLLKSGGFCNEGTGLFV
ncbi:ABC transporter ATP-binding protein [Paenibacillus sp. CAU 1782]